MALFTSRSLEKRNNLATSTTLPFSKMLDDESPERAGQSSQPWREQYIGIPRGFNKREHFDSYVTPVQLSGG